MIDKDCKSCGGEGWVCEFHLETSWGDGKGCCGGAGKNCLCNPDGDMPEGFLCITAIPEIKIKNWLQ